MVGLFLQGLGRELDVLGIFHPSTLTHICQTAPSHVTINHWYGPGYALCSTQSNKSSNTGQYEASQLMAFIKHVGNNIMDILACEKNS